MIVVGVVVPDANVVGAIVVAVDVAALCFLLL